MLKLFSRLREPSTLAGLSALAILAGARSDLVQAVNVAVPHIVDGVTALLALGAVIVRESK